MRDIIGIVGIVIGGIGAWWLASAVARIIGTTAARLAGF